MREQEKRDIRTVRPKRRGKPSPATPQICPTCRHLVVLPCVACRTRDWQRDRFLKRLTDA